ncbi:MAG: Gfo/Idh/MocA family oxidoreductase [Gemmatimonadetes bacterium]|nr:Gfo/Idh/MocA family oxidoreductase [Gemmatimonadota bacterium]
MSEHLDRRKFLKTAASTGVGVGLAAHELAGRPAFGSAPATGSLASAPLDVVRIGFVGVGNQGTSHVRNFLRIEGVEIRAICDLLPRHVERAQSLVTKAGRPLPVGYSSGPDDFRRLCERDDIDLVFTATPWELHAPVMLAALAAGKHAATEIPLAVNVEECWALVEAAEKAQRHCVMMENCCYDRTEMAILNMVRQNVFGELLHAECGYLHDLRKHKLTDQYVNRWRVKHSITRNGDLYPMHGLGPVAQWMDINRGNQFDYLVSMGGPSRGLNLWAAEHIGPESPEAKQRYALSDVVNTLVRTHAGQTILITHDTNSPRPYSRKILLQGTEGLIRKYPEQKIHLEGRSKEHQWEAAQAYLQQYDHPIWKELEEKSRGAGHGGMDFIEDYRLIQALRSGMPTDMDVYDGAAWSSVTELTERSIAGRSRPVDFPDFTRGAWRTRRPLMLPPHATGV